MGSPLIPFDFAYKITSSLKQTIPRSSQRYSQDRKEISFKYNRCDKLSRVFETRSEVVNFWIVKCNELHKIDIY